MKKIMESLTEDMKKAMKDGDKVKLSVIRMLRSELKNAAIAAGRELELQEEEKVLSMYAKKRKESIEKYQEGGREDLAEKERLEHEITVSYLPPKIKENELRALIDKCIEESSAEGMKNFGQIMKAVMAEAGSRVEGAEVSKLLKAILSSKE